MRLDSLFLLVFVNAIYIVGLIMIFNTTSAEILDLSLEQSPYESLIRQVIYGVGGVLVGLSAYRVGYRFFLKYAPQLLVFFSLLLLLCLIPGIGREVNGSKRWISLLGLSLQPSEFVKLLIPLYFLSEEREWTLKSFLLFLGTIFVPMLLILVEPNNGTVAVIGCVLIVLFLLSRVPMKFWVAPLVVVMLMGIGSAWQLPYVRGRLMVYWNPELDVRGRGHQPLQSKIAAGSGGLYGKGPGNSLQKLSYLPEAQNDYIAAIYAEEFGLVGVCFLIAAYMMIAYLGMKIALLARNRSAGLLAATLTFLITFQAFLNLGVVSGLLPSTGLNLPFFSQGGSSLLANCMGLGLLLHIGEEL